MLLSRYFVRARRQGFTLIELLVVIAIIAILIGLLVPAVQKVRDAAARAQCQNNLKQMGLALHSHHDTRKTLPPGGMQTGRNGTPCYTNWAIEILPYIEQAPLYKRYDQRVLNEHDNNRFVNQSRVPVYECPSDLLIGRLERPASGPRRYNYMHGSYRAVSGRSGAIGRGFWDTFEDQFWPPNWIMLQSWRGPLHGTAAAYNGIPAQNATGQRGSPLSQMGGPEKLANIIDGTSNTLMVGECTFIDVSNRATFWSYTYASYNQSSVTTESRILTVEYNKCARLPGQGGDNPCKRAFGSLHTGGMNFVLCDGSVRFVSESVDINLLAAMATIAGGEVVTSID
jgi:prepilin-type N-terminal cleavage/methylation domain-containing protein/prepilin-type processing-associated H-X9-DG protein